MRFFGMDSFEQWLETELRNADTEPGSTVPAPRYAALEPPHHRGGVVRLLAGFGATKSALAASAVVALAAAGVVTGKAVTTGDPNPFDSNWGRAVTQQVQTCKGELGTNQHGIGPCVSAKAKTHGDSVSESPPPGQGPGFVPIAPHPTGAPPSLPGAATNHAPAPPSPAAPTPATATATPTPAGPGNSGHHKPPHP